MSDGRFIRFDRKEDNVGQIISANDINELQSVSEQQQTEMFKQQDEQFLDKALFVLNNHRSLNQLWVDIFSDVSKIDLPKSQNLIFSDSEKAVTFAQGSLELEGVLYSSTYINPNGSNIKKVILMARATVPEGSSIRFEVSNNGADYHPITPGTSEPFEIPSDGQRLKLRAIFTRNHEGLFPRLEAWAALFRDPQLDIVELPNGDKVVIGDPDKGDYDNFVNIKHSQLLQIGPDDHHPQKHSHDGDDGSGLVSHMHLTDIGPDDHHPKDHQHGVDGIAPVNLTTDVVGTLGTQFMSHQVWTGRPGQTGLFFDPKLDDKLVYVKTPDDETYLFYDKVENRLSHTITIRRGVAVWETLIFGEYINSKNQSTIVLKGTESKHYDATADEIRIEIEKVTAPSKPQNLQVLPAANPNELLIRWDPNVEHDILGYDVFMSTSPTGTFTKLNTVGYITGTDYIMTGLTPGTRYYFYIVATDTYGYESVKSDVVNGTP